MTPNFLTRKAAKIIQKLDKKFYSDRFHESVQGWSRIWFPQSLEFQPLHQHGSHNQGIRLYRTRASASGVLSLIFWVAAHKSNKFHRPIQEERTRGIGVFLSMRQWSSQSGNLDLLSLCPLCSPWLKFSIFQSWSCRFLNFFGYIDVQNTISMGKTENDSGSQRCAAIFSACNDRT